jgi:hypothetical protein
MLPDVSGYGNVAALPFGRKTPYGFFCLLVGMKRPLHQQHAAVEEDQERERVCDRRRSAALNGFTSRLQ